MAAEEKKTGGDVKTFFQKLAENEKYRRVVLLLGVLGIALIFLSGFFQDRAAESKAASASAQTGVTDADQYVKQLEENLADIVNGISGGTDAKVMITLEKGTQYVYATEQKKSQQKTQDQNTGTTTRNQENNSLETNYIIVKDADGSQKALAITEVQPVVKGVIVVCKGGDLPSVQQNIIDAVTTALNISSARVCVIKQN